MGSKRLYHHFSVLLARAYYRVSVAGDPVPPRGPVLLVANHPNSLLDPALVGLAARRPVRFLARAPLFQHPGLGWFVRGMGAIPIYRRVDHPRLITQNEDTFEAVWRALAEEGAAVGIFPEGLSHGGPSLAPLKTGAARIALGAARTMGGTFPIIPVGLTFRAKEHFRSEALALVGKEVEWDDLASPTPDLGPDTVRELTRRIGECLTEVTLNLERWEDVPLVEAVERVDAAEAGGGSAPEEQLRRRRKIGSDLASMRRGGSPEWEDLARDVQRHDRVLSHLHLRPEDLRSVPPATVALRWIFRNVFFFGLLAPLALLGGLIFWAPLHFVGLVEERMELSPEVRASYKVIGGTIAFTGWALLLAIWAFRSWSWAAAAGVLLVLPILGLAMCGTHGRWGNAIADLRRFVLLRERSDIRTRLLVRQRDLASRLSSLRQSLNPTVDEPLESEEVRHEQA